LKTRRGPLRSAPAERSRPGRAGAGGGAVARGLLRMHAQHSLRGRDASGRVLSRAGYYASMRSSRAESGAQAGRSAHSRAITHTCAAVAPRVVRKRAGPLTRELLRIHAQQSRREWCASGRARSLASYYACMRSTSPQVKTRAGGCPRSGAITHACVIARRRGHHPGRAGGDRLARVSRASSAPAHRRHPPTRRHQAGQGSGSGAWRAISVRISASCCTAQATAELKPSAVCSQGRRPPSSRQCA
jgi:hypothetical protein